MIGVAVNSIAVILGSLLGLLFKKGISEKISSAVMVAVGLCTVFIGISGMLVEINPLVAVVSMVLGAIIGTIIDIDRGLTALGDKVSSMFSKKGNGSFTQGFVSASLLFCVGAMAVTGSINAGISGDNSVLFTKSILDFTAAIMFTSTFGIGVVFSIIPLTLYQGGIALCAGFLEPVLSEGAVNSLSCVGSIIIMGLGLNIAGVSKFKIANFLPAILIAPFIFYLFELII